MKNSYTRSDIEKILKKCERSFLKKESVLFDVNGSERSITHKFAEYLQKEFGFVWDVDCEYNRDSDKIKKLPREEGISCVGGAVYPDIIVHRRTKSENLLVIEAKKDVPVDKATEDKLKLDKFKKVFGYKFAIYLNFNTKDSSIDYYFIGI